MPSTTTHWQLKQKPNSINAPVLQIQLTEMKCKCQSCSIYNTRGWKRICRMQYSLNRALWHKLGNIIKWLTRIKFLMLVRNAGRRSCMVNLNYRSSDMASNMTVPKVNICKKPTKCLRGLQIKHFCQEAHAMYMNKMLTMVMAVNTRLIKRAVSSLMS